MNARQIMADEARRILWRYWLKAFLWPSPRHLAQYRQARLISAFFIR